MSDISRLSYDKLYEIQNPYNNSQGVKRQNQNNNDESIFKITKDENYQKDTQQLLEDKNYFNELRMRIQNGDMDAFEELNALSVGELVDGTDENAKLYNENTKMLQQLKQKTPSDNFFMKKE